MARRFTGRHMFTVMLAFFGTVAAVNFAMARYASSTFGGVLVENSYVASQEFNTWLEAAEASRALGWQVDLQRSADGHLALSVSGAPDPLGASAIARHPLGRAPDRSLSFTRIAPGSYVSNSPLPHGRWTVRLQLDDGNRVWRGEVAL